MTTTSVVAQRLRFAVPRVPPGLAVASVFLVLVIVAVVWPALFAPTDPLRIDLTIAHSAPSSHHPFGTDQLGRDVWTRVVHGARLSIAIGVSATLLAVAIGVPLGLVSGLGNRIVDTVLSRCFDLLGAFPEILLALVLIALTGTGTTNLILAIGIASAPRFARVMRAETRVVSRADYVTHARLTTRRLHVVGRHILPNAVTTLPVLITLGLGTSILGAAALSFLGFGPQPPTPEWGSMLAEARDDLRIASWSVFFPGLAINATVIASTVVGRAAARRFEYRDPR
ncbi:ABC transporter permease [Williamsia sp. M5A3_1d]